jgi:CHAT domain-containing protein
MGTSPRGLWIVLTLWMVVLRPSATVPPGTPASGWWGTPESKALQKNVGQHLRSGNFAAAEADFEVCLAGARQWHDPVSESRCLSGIAGTHTARFEYEKAFDVYLQARDVAAASGDRVDLGAVDFNLSSLFLQTSDDASALRSAEAAQAAIEGLPHVYYQPQLLWQLGALHQLREDQPGAPWLEQAIEAARAGEAGDKSLVAVEARIWDALGEEYMAARDLDRAERAYLEAYRLRRLSPQHELGRRDLGFSYARLGALKLARAEALARTEAEPQALLDDAERLTLRAMEQPVTLPVFSLRYQLGRIRLAQGKRRAALDDLGAAADAALAWLEGVPAALSSLDKASGSISDVFATFVETAAAYGLDTGDQAWIEQSFEAAEVGRAVNPRTSQGMSEVWRTRLPPSFWATLDKLRSVEASLIRSGARKSLASEQLKLELTEMEARAGLGFIPTNTENFHNRNSLNHFQQGIDESEVLLSFALGEQQGFLWVVTKGSLKTYRLAPREQIRAAIREFREAVEDGRTEAETLGRHLYTMLFGQLSPEEADRPKWRLSLDDELYRLPFAALVPTAVSGKASGKVVYLAEQHSFQIMSGEAGPRSTPAAETFLGVGDPIYNTADARWAGGPGSWFRMVRNEAAGQHNRLPGSGREVEACARAWGDAAASTVLEGAGAQAQRFEQELRRPHAVIHLATHVVMPPGQLEQASLLFSLDGQGQAGSLSSADVGLLHVPGALVVMTGCSTAGGPRTGVGLAGLARAWRLAGASAVVATQWPVKDASGEMLAQFYRYFRGSPAAEALQRSQKDEIRKGTSPALWAAYQVFGDTQ